MTRTSLADVAGVVRAKFVALRILPSCWPLVQKVNAVACPTRINTQKPSICFILQYVKVKLVLDPLLAQIVPSPFPSFRRPWIRRQTA